MRALVTGGTGFIGRHLVAELRRRRWNIVCLVRNFVEPSDSSIQLVRGDLLHPASLRFDDIDGKVDALFHFAAQLPSNDVSTAQYLTANCISTARLLDAATQLDIKAVVYASSLPIIGRPTRLPITEEHSAQPMSSYHLSKLCGEMTCETERRLNGRGISSLRVTSPYGPGMSPTVLARFVHCALHSEPIQWLGDGSRAQNFVHVSDVVNAALLAVQAECPGVYNIGGSETITMQDLARLVVRLVVGTQSKASSASTVDPEEGVRWDIDHSRASTVLGYRPKIALEQGLRDYIAWVKSKAEATRWWKA